jgi:hypothetical protein
MQCACAILPSVAGPTLQYFSPLPHTQPEIPKNVIEHKGCVLFSLQLLSETFLIVRRTERDMIKKAYWSSLKVFNILCRILIKVGFFGQIFEKYSNFKLH